MSQSEQANSDSSIPDTAPTDSELGFSLFDCLWRMCAIIFSFTPLLKTNDIEATPQSASYDWWLSWSQN